MFINLNKFFEAIPEIKEQHSPLSATHNFLSEIVNKDVKNYFAENTDELIKFGPYGKIHLPYHSMGAVNSYDMFDFDGLILYSFYWLNRNRYKKVADLGANIGLHSILFSRCGYKVRSYEPDPVHYKILSANIKSNDCAHVEMFNAAVSDKEGKMDFIRVLGNTTGSHLAGSKMNPYGELETIEVDVIDIRPIMNWADFVKFDVEGHEKQLVLATTSDDWISTDAMMEVGTLENAEAIYGWLTHIGVGMFSQKNNWKRVGHLDEMPHSYHDGSLFISNKDNVPWES